MASVEYSTTAKLPVEAIWDFVKDMDNWAGFVAGYQEHEVQNQDDSIWVLKGDVGSLTRTLKFAVHVSEWAGPERVTFELKGLNEQMKGSGQFTMERFEDPEAEAAAPERKSFFTRWIEALVRFFYRRARGVAARADSADAGPGAGMARMTFHLTLEPGGPMAPMINAMMKPAMKVAAEDLANRIVGRLETDRASR
ncbi:MAG: SRPBCC family protein [Proteobacteria bacterium]|nr:SRPBCC family protein [Pseudomonadota bacterium]